MHLLVLCDVTHDAKGAPVTATVTATVTTTATNATATTATATEQGRAHALARTRAKRRTSPVLVKTSRAWRRHHPHRRLGP